jgi:hypothetical protein
MIILSSMSLVIGTYNSYYFMEILDYIITGFFILECAIKIITQGLILESNTYLRDSWSQLDFVIVAFSLMDIS